MVFSSIRQQVQVKVGLSAGCVIDGSNGVLPVAPAAVAGATSGIAARIVRRSRLVVVVSARETFPFMAVPLDV
jgi:hypothetical protein